MSICLAVLLFTIIYVPQSTAILGSLPQNMPTCLHGGTMEEKNDRLTCKCPVQGMDRQCKLTRVTLGGEAFDLQVNPTVVDFISVTTFHLGLQYITNDATGNGSILTVKNPQRQPQFHLFLMSGRPGISINLNNLSQEMQFSDKASPTNDNAWHHLDLFLQYSPATNKITLHLLLDQCRGVSTSFCSISTELTPTSGHLTIGGFLQFGMNSNMALSTLDGCLDRVFFQRTLIDFYPATRVRPSIRGCSGADQGCMMRGEKICGNHGRCQNALRMTDMSTCLCEPGYQPDKEKALHPHRWPCTQASTPWSTTAMEYNAKFLNKVPARFRMSVRTRQQNFDVFYAASWKLRLTIEGGVPKLLFRDITKKFEKLNISDGNWHLFDVTFTTSFIEVQIDEFDGDYYFSRRFDPQVVPEGVIDFVVAKDAENACLDDAWVDFVNTWKNTEHDYPLEVIAEPTYTRRLDWSTRGRVHSCSAGNDLCNTSRPCDKGTLCVNEWRGYRCECPPGEKINSSGSCQVEQCVPNPCGNGFCRENNISNSTETRNFTCECYNGWQGVLCNESRFSKAGILDWWWILLVALLVLLFIVLIILIICCCCRTASDVSDSSLAIDDENLGGGYSAQDPWDHGEKDYIGHINYAALDGMNHVKPTEEYIPAEDVTRDKFVGVTSPDYALQDHGQPTSDIPPWEKFEVEDTMDLNLDQALEYGYEGFDGKPPPEFCADEPLEDCISG